MNDQSVVDTLRDSMLDLVNGAVEFVPKILAALLIFIIGLIVAGAISRLVKKALGFVESNKTVNNMAEKLGLKVVTISGILGTFVRWAVLLIFISAAIDVLGVAVLSDTFNSLIAFLPKIFAAALIGGLAYVAANVVHDVTATALKEAGVKAGKGIAGLAKIVVMVFGVTLAAAQLGLDLTIINNNITVIVAGVMLAFGIAFGFGGRDVAAKILEEQYKNFKK